MSCNRLVKPQNYSKCFSPASENALEQVVPRPDREVLTKLNKRADE